MPSTSVPLRDLSDPDQELVRQCVAAIADGPFIDDDEFATRVGVPRTTLRALLSMWPHIDDAADASDPTVALNNSMNEVCHGVQLSSAEWAAYFTVPREQVEDVYRRWSQSRGWSNTGVR